MTRTLGSMPRSRWTPLAGSSVVVVFATVVVFGVMSLSGIGAATEVRRAVATGGRQVVECPHARQPLQSSPDALPRLGETTYDRVAQVATSEEPRIRTHFRGGVSLSVEPRNGQVWNREHGTIVTLDVNNYWLVVQVRSLRDCPNRPWAWDGIPVRFVVQRTSTSPTTVPIPNVRGPTGVPSVDPARWEAEWTRTPGTSQRRCISVRPGWSDVRSHSFIVGNFNSYRHDWNGTLTGSKLYYVPLWPDPFARPQLKIDAKPLDGRPAAPVTLWGGLAYAWGQDGTPLYATGTLLPRTGRWRLIATAGPNWGCFDFTL